MVSGQPPCSPIACSARHVDVVDVGPLLAVDLHVDEQARSSGGGFGVLERLVRHDVAPVAGGVADRQQDRAVAPLGLRERLRRPTGANAPDCWRAAAGRARSRRRGDCGRCPSRNSAPPPRALSASAALSIALNFGESKVHSTSAPSLSPAAARPDVGVDRRRRRRRAGRRPSCRA